MRTARASDGLFYLVVGVLTVLAAVPFWLTHLLPMQDYPQFLVFARVFGDCRDPATPFFGTYAVRFALSPLVLPILVTRALAGIGGIGGSGGIGGTMKVDRRNQSLALPPLTPPRNRS